MEDPPIIAVDGSEASLQAVEWAAREATLRSQPLRIVSVPALPPRMVHQRGMLGRPATVTDTVRQAYTDALAEATARATATEPGLAVTTALLSGAPATVIAQLASPVRCWSWDPAAQVASAR